MSNSEVTPQVVRPLAKSLMRRDRSKAPTAIHGPSGLKLLRLEETNTVVLTVWKISSHHMTCVRKTMNGEWRLVFRLCFKPWMTVPLKQ
jgi:hypothetical protein